MKRILITGKNSYIGRQVKEYLEKFKKQYIIDEIDTKTLEYRESNFIGYDVIFNVAGIAHQKITEDMEPLFYKVNRDLAVELCQKAKLSGVKQYIYISSMNVYGDTMEKIVSRNQENPQNFYGRSKLEADLEIHKLSDDCFKVVSIRPPVVYGKNCKGNFNTLVKLAKFIPLYPTYKNKRSMIYIENLCIFIKWLIDTEADGYYHPQNIEYVSTSECIKVIRDVLKKKSYKISLFNPLINFLKTKNHLIDRAFSDDYYDKGFSDILYDEFISDFETTIRNTLRD